ncbi:hypothetical protein BJX65DRAFT_301999 [Aspergillus insuetus]
MSVLQALSSIHTQGDQHRTPTNTPPHADKTYIIRSHSTNLAITLRGNGAGALQLHPLEGDPLTNITAHWRCIENPRRWLGFRNVASDTYMGQNGAWFVENWRVVAEVRHHDLHEFFSTRAHPDGGVELLVWTKNGFRGVRVGAAGEGSSWFLLRRGRGGVRGSLLVLHRDPVAVYISLWNSV